MVQKPNKLYWLVDPCRFDSELRQGFIFPLHACYSIGFHSNFDASVYLDAILALHGNMTRTTHIHSGKGGGGGETTMNIQLTHNETKYKSTYVISRTVLLVVLLWYWIFWGIISSNHQNFASLSWSYIGVSASARSSSASFTKQFPSVYTTALRSSCTTLGSGTGMGCFLGSWQTIGGLGRITSGKILAGSSPTFRRVSLWNMIPVFAKKHCRIIQRRGIRARLLRVPLTTEPPPISELYWGEYSLSLNSIKLDTPTTMTARKPHFFNVGHRFGFCKLVFEMSQPSRTGAVVVDIVAFAARHFIALEAFFVIMVLWTVPCTGFETTSFFTTMRTFY